jgi:hypothetical protein
MEFHDKMKKSRVRIYQSGLLLGIIWAVVLFQQFVGDKTTPFLRFIIVEVIAAMLTGIIIYANWFYYKRPDFVITEHTIVFSNLSLAFYLRNRILPYTVEWGQIEQAFIHPTGITFKIKNFREDIDVWEKHLDDYPTAKKIIIEQLEKRKIPSSRSSS